MNDSLSLILKTVERCNLNCSYCYFFNGNDKTYKNRPKFIENIDALAKFIKTGISDLNLNNIHIVLHGGEPLMQPKKEFIYLIENLHEALSGTEFTISMQTNATLISEKWIDLLNKYKISVGVSIDGPEEYHNLSRLNHSGHGSYEQTVRGIKLLQDKLDSEVGCLTVINPSFSGAEIYRHLVDLGFKTIDFLLPDNNYCVPPTHNILSYAKYMIDVFDAWIKDNNPKVSIRKLKTMILQLLGGPPLIYGFGIMPSSNDSTVALLSIRSDGEILPTDELMFTDPQAMKLNKNILNHSLSEVLQHNIFTELKTLNFTKPLRCQKCCWYKACGGGNLVTRYSKENRFNNPSIYCLAYQQIFAHISAYLIKAGVCKQTILENLTVAS